MPAAYAAPAPMMYRFSLGLWRVLLALSSNERSVIALTGYAKSTSKLRQLIITYDLKLFFIETKIGSLFSYYYRKAVLSSNNLWVHLAHPGLYVARFVVVGRCSSSRGLVALSAGLSSGSGSSSVLSISCSDGCWLFSAFSLLKSLNSSFKLSKLVTCSRLSPPEKVVFRVSGLF